MCLTETCLTADISNSDILSSDEFAVYRRGRDNHGGGILLGVHSSLTSKARPDLAPQSNWHIEILVFELHMQRSKKIAIVSVYNPPLYSNAEGTSQLRETLQCITMSGIQEICMLGDFNLPNFGYRHWNSC